MCARVYLLGVVASLPTLHRLLGPSFRGIERDVGYDRRALLFHSFQSLLFSLAFLVPLALVWALAPGGSGAFPVVALGCLLTKIAILNPWLAWLHFRKADGTNDLRLPLVAGVAQKLAELALPRSTTASQDTVYFSGARPFVGSAPTPPAGSRPSSRAKRGRGPGEGRCGMPPANLGIINTGSIGGDANVRLDLRRIADDVRIRAKGAVVNVKGRMRRVRQNLSGGKTLPARARAELEDVVGELAARLERVGERMPSETDRVLVALEALSKKLAAVIALLPI
jgi:hypothetical protein